METIKWDGQPISKPGVYSGISMEDYHGQLTAGPSVSSSGLRTILKQSPAHYFVNSYLNPDREEEEVKDHFDFGRAAHTLLLGESGFKEKYAIRPEIYDSWRTDAAKKWRISMEEAGRTVLLPEDIGAIKGIAAQLARDPIVGAGILQGEVERTIVWQDKDTGIWVKVRPDVIPESDGMAADLKTTTDASPLAIAKAVDNFGYHQQGALIGEGFRQVLDIDMTDFVLVWIEKKAPFVVNVSPVEDQWIHYGGLQNRRALNIFAACVEEGNWPGYPSDVTTRMPEYVAKRFAFMEKHGTI